MLAGKDWAQPRAQRQDSSVTLEQPCDAETASSSLPAERCAIRNCHGDALPARPAAGPAVPAAACLSPVHGPAPALLAAAPSAHPRSCPACSAGRYEQWSGQLGGNKPRIKQQSPSKQRIQTTFFLQLARLTLYSCHKPRMHQNQKQLLSARQLPLDEPEAKKSTLTAIHQLWKGKRRPYLKG